MSELSNEQDNLWVQCPPGAIKTVADSVMVSRAARPATDLQRRKMLIATATAAGVAVLGGGVAYVATRDQKPAGASSNGSAPMANYIYAGIGCVEVAQALPAYIGQTIEDQTQVEKIKKHLELCDKCRMIYERQLVELKG